MTIRRRYLLALAVVLTAAVVTTLALVRTPGATSGAEREHATSADGDTFPLARALRVHGRVLDENGMPLPGAGIHLGLMVEVSRPEGLREPMARTGDDGRFAVAIDEGTLADLLLITAPSRVAFVDTRPASRIFDEVGAELAIGDVRLPPGVECRGRVRDDRGEPVVGAIVSAVDALAPGFYAEPSLGGLAQTDDDGEFVLPAVFARAITLQVCAPGCFDHELRCVAPDAPLDVRVERSGYVEGFVRDVDGAPYDGLVGLQYEWLRGQISLDRVVAGRFRVLVRHRCRFGAWVGDPTGVVAPGPVLDGPAQDVQLRFAPPPDDQCVRVRAVDADGRAVGGVRAWLERHRFSTSWVREPEPLRWSLRAAWADGAVRLPPPGFDQGEQGHAYVTAPGFASKLLRDVSWASGSEHVIPLDRESRVVGRVVDGGTGLPAGRVLLHATRAGAPHRATPPVEAAGRTAADGTFVLEGLTAGIWNVRAEHEQEAGSAVETQVTVRAVATHDGIELRLPPRHAIAGRITGVEPGPGWRVGRRRQRPRNAWWERGDGVLASWNLDGSVPLPADGTFRLEGCADGRHALVLFVPQPVRQGAALRIPLGEVAVRGEDQHVEIDAGPHRPALLRGTLRVQGADLPDGRLAVVAHPVRDPSAWFDERDVHWSLATTDGRWTIPVAPGEYRFEVVDLFTGIRLLEHGETIRVAAGELATIDLTARVGTVHVVLRSTSAQHGGCGLIVATGLNWGLMDPELFGRTRFGRAGLPIDGSTTRARLVVPACRFRLEVEGGAARFAHDAIGWNNWPLARTDVAVQPGETVRVDIDVPAPGPFEARK